METNQLNLNSKSPRHRVKVGVQIENNIANCLNAHHGFDLREVTMAEDTQQKIDRILHHKDGTQQKVQIKTRMSGEDILVDVYEPFFGVAAESTQLGRDMRSNYDVYICLSKDGKTIRVINGKRQKELIGEVLKEWESAKWPLPTFNSTKYKGVQVKFHADKWSGRPKLLMFVPPTVYETGKEIQYYAMKGIE